MPVLYSQVPRCDPVRIAGLPDSNLSATAAVAHGRAASAPSRSCRCCAVHPFSSGSPDRLPDGCCWHRFPPWQYCAAVPRWLAFSFEHPDSRFPESSGGVASRFPAAWRGRQTAGRSARFRTVVLISVCRPAVSCIALRSLRRSVSPAQVLSAGSLLGYGRLYRWFWRYSLSFSCLRPCLSRLLMQDPDPWKERRNLLILPFQTMVP